MKSDIIATSAGETASHWLRTARSLEQVWTRVKGEPMEIVAEKVSEVAVVLLPVEELDASNAGELKRDVGPVLEANSQLVIDLSRLRFVDSSGLGAILSCLRQVSAKGGDLKLCGMSKQVRATFELVRMHRIFEIFSSREEAVRAFDAQKPQP